MKYLRIFIIIAILCFTCSCTSGSIKSAKNFNDSSLPQENSNDISFISASYEASESMNDTSSSESKDDQQNSSDQTSKINRSVASVNSSSIINSKASSISSSSPANIDNSSQAHTSSDNKDSFSSSKSSSSVVEELTFEWEITNGKVKLARYTGNAKNVDIPEKYNNMPVEIIGYDSFRSTPAQIVTTPNTLKKIELGAFGASKVKVLNISQNVSVIENFLFENTNTVEAVNVDSKNNYFCSVDGILFNKNKTVLVYYPNHKSGISYTVPNSVQLFDVGCFSQNRIIETIYIPSSVIYLDWGAMSNCTALKSIYFEGNAPTVPSAPFNGTYDAKIYYHENTHGWTNPWWNLPIEKY